MDTRKQEDLSVSKTKVPIKERALLARLNRKLAHDGFVVKKSRGARSIQELGYYYMLSTHSPSIVDTHISLAVKAEEEGVLQDYEELVD